VSPARAATTIALDGPAAGGKTSVGKRLAQRLGYLFVDTGVMYRAVTWLALYHGVAPEDEQRLGELARACRIEISQQADDLNTPTSVVINGHDVTTAVMSPEVSAAVSLVARFPAVREAMVERQRRLASQGPVVMSGRDIGTVVLPYADVKIYLTASVEERARRRYEEVQQRGEATEFQDILQDVQSRDTLDAARPVAPMRPAKDAIIVDTTGLGLEQVVNTLYHIVLTGAKS
jgi:cytidylate kinase